MLVEINIISFIVPVWFSFLGENHLRSSAAQTLSGQSVFDPRVPWVSVS